MPAEATGIACTISQASAVNAYTSATLPAIQAGTIDTHSVALSATALSVVVAITTAQITLIHRWSSVYMVKYAPYCAATRPNTLAASARAARLGDAQDADEDPNEPWPLTTSACGQPTVQRTGELDGQLLRSRHVAGVVGAREGLDGAGQALRNVVAPPRDAEAPKCEGRVEQSVRCNCWMRTPCAGHEVERSRQHGRMAAPGVAAGRSRRELLIISALSQPRHSPRRARVPTAWNASHGMPTRVDEQGLAD